MHMSINLIHSFCVKQTADTNDEKVKRVCVITHQDLAQKKIQKEIKGK